MDNKGPKGAFFWDWGNLKHFLIVIVLELVLYCHRRGGNLTQIPKLGIVVVLVLENPDRFAIRLKEAG